MCLVCRWNTIGVNFGQLRNRLEELKATNIVNPVVLASIGETDMEVWQYDYQQVADQINEELDRVQKDYNERFNFPPPWAHNH